MLSKTVDNAHSETSVQLPSMQLEAPGPSDIEGTDVVLDATTASMVYNKHSYSPVFSFIYFFS